MRLGAGFDSRLRIGRLWLALCSSMSILPFTLADEFWWMASKGMVLTSSYTCQLLGQSNSGATCQPIGGNGSSGVYGDLSYCNPATKLNYAISAYYEYNPVDSSCDFAGNATLASPRKYSLHLACCPDNPLPREFSIIEI